MFRAAYKGSNIARAGRANHLGEAIAYTTAYSTNPGDIAKAGMKADAAKYITDKETDAKIDYNNKTTKARMAGLDKYSNAFDVAKTKGQFAGILGLTGALTYGLTKPKLDIPKPEPRKSADNSEVFKEYEAQIETLKQQIEGYKDFNSQDIPSTETIYQGLKGKDGDSTSTADSTGPTKLMSGPFTGKVGGAGWGALGTPSLPPLW